MGQGKPETGVWLKGLKGLNGWMAGWLDGYCAKHQIVNCKSSPPALCKDLTGGQVMVNILTLSHHLSPALLPR